jgi:hypothetical protein
MADCRPTVHMEGEVVVALVVLVILGLLVPRMRAAVAE